MLVNNEWYRYTFGIRKDNTDRVIAGANRLEDITNIYTNKIKDYANIDDNVILYIHDDDSDIDIYTYDTTTDIS